MFGRRAPQPQPEPEHEPHEHVTLAEVARTAALHRLAHVPDRDASEATKAILDEYLDAIGVGR